MSRSNGFSLVELMVAMVIGLIIILGAGQLFLTVFQTNRQIELLGEKQAAVNFAVESLLRDIRRAGPGIGWSNGELSLTVPNRGDIAGCGDDINKIYRLSDSVVGPRLGRALEMGQKCNGVVEESDFFQIVAGFEDDDEAFSVDPVQLSDGIALLTLRLIPAGNGPVDVLEFYAVNRTAAVTN
ncbi:PilW family protein [Halomonas sp.]|uniref:PilW family protein n=1 Tax=Halomonas sp. TaxID=1486246 RepID=UPI00384EE938